MIRAGSEPLDKVGNCLSVEERFLADFECERRDDGERHRAGGERPGHDGVGGFIAGFSRQMGPRPLVPAEAFSALIASNDELKPPT